MHRFIFMFAAAWLLFAPPALAAETHAALVKGVTGEVTVTRGVTTGPVTSGARLHVSDRIVTGPGSSASIVFRDGTMLTLGGNADVRVRDYVFEPQAGKYAFSLYMEKGAAIYESGKIGKLAPDEVEVETPRATVGVRGTRFLIEAG